MAIDINEIAINEAIRYHKPNDPYYWEVDNLPLIDIMRNIVLTADKINELVLEINNHYDKGEIDNLRTRDLFDVDDVTPALNNILKWNGTTYTPGPGSSWTYELGDVYHPNPNTNPNANNQEGWVLKWSDTLNQFYQFAPELKDNINVNIPAWNDYSAAGNKDGDMLLYDDTAGGIGAYVNKQNTFGVMTDCDSRPSTGRHALTTNGGQKAEWRDQEEVLIEKTVSIPGHENNGFDFQQLVQNTISGGFIDDIKIDMSPYISKGFGGASLLPTGWYPEYCTIKTRGISSSGSTTGWQVWLGGYAVGMRYDSLLFGDTTSGYRKMPIEGHVALGHSIGTRYSLTGDGTGSGFDFPYISPRASVTWTWSGSNLGNPQGSFNFHITSITFAKKFYVQSQA